MDTVSELGFAADLASAEQMRNALDAHAQIWPGGAREAIAQLKAGARPKLLIVDIDASAYPQGDLTALAEVCPEHCIVIAAGTDTSTEMTRELLLAGIADYLPKPLDPDHLYSACERALREHRAPGGIVCAMIGPPGAGATSTCAAMAIAAARNGATVTCIDIDRRLGGLSFILDAEPKPGFESLVESSEPTGEAAAATSATRHQRIQVLGYPWDRMPAGAAAPHHLAVLAQESAERSHAVLIDGVAEHPDSRAILAYCDAAVLIDDGHPARMERWRRWLPGHITHHGARVHAKPGTPRAGASHEFGFCKQWQHYTNQGCRNALPRTIEHSAYALWQAVQQR